MKRKNKILPAMLVGSALLLVVAFLLLARQWRQDTLDNALFQALRRRDLTATRTALDRGANPNTRYEILTAPDAPSGSTSFVVKWWNRFTHQPSGRSRYAPLIVPLSPHPSDYARVGPLLTVLVQHGADPNVADAYGTTPLLYAADAMDLPTVRLLLDHKANPNAYDAFDNSPLCYAVGRHRNPDNVMLRLLLEHGADPNKMDGDRSVPLQAAMAENNVEGAALLLDHGADANHGDERSFETILAQAINGEQPDIVRLLLQHGARVGAIGRHDETAMELARKLPRTSKHRATLIRMLEAATR